MQDREAVTGTGEPGGQAKGARDRRGTRPAILGAAQELFAAHGYAGTSVADITGRLGMSKAALYYHFRSKTEILRALLDEPVAAYSRLADSAAAGQLGARDLLGAVIDTTADLRALIDVIGNDPSARSALQDLLPRSREVNEAITAALAGPRPDPPCIIRAHAAYAAAKNGTLALLTARGGHLARQDRAELLAAAERALTAGAPAAAKDQERDEPAGTPGTARLLLTHRSCSGHPGTGRAHEHPRSAL
jgi:AcrR family transcriptional regulator